MYFEKDPWRRDLILLVKMINLEGKQAKKSSHLKNARLPKIILKSVLWSTLLLLSQGLVSILVLLFLCHETLEREDRNVALRDRTEHLPKLRQAKK